MQWQMLGCSWFTMHATLFMRTTSKYVIVFVMSDTIYGISLIISHIITLH